MSPLATGEATGRPAPSLSPKKLLQAALVIGLIVAASIGGAFYYYRYGDKTTPDDKVIAAQTKQILKIDVPTRLWPKLMVTRPDVMTMVVYTPFKETAEQACLAIVSCEPEWAHEKGNRPLPLLQSALQQYFPHFETERWTDAETRDVPIRGRNEKVVVATSYRVEDHKEVRVVSIDNLVTDKGAIALYYQTPATSTVDDDIETLLKSLN